MRIVSRQAAEKAQNALYNVYGWCFARPWFPRWALRLMESFCNRFSDLVLPPSSLKEDVWRRKR